MMRRRKRNNLDEMQEQKMLQVEKGSFWLLYWLLAASIIVQIMSGAPPLQVAGELVPFLIVCVFLVSACLRQGLWDRTLKPDLRTNLWVSGLAVAVVLILNAVCGVSLRARGLELKTGTLVLFTLLPGVLTFLLCMTVLSVCAGILRKRTAALEREEETDEADMSGTGKENRADISGTEEAYSIDMSTTEKAHRFDVDRTEKAYRTDMSEMEKSQRGGRL